jgi:hypothetical protein
MPDIKKAFRLLAAALCALTPIAARAAQIQAVTLPNDQPAITFGGVITPGDEKKFHEILGTVTNPIVVLSGPGGGVAPALAIGQEIRNNGLTTLVPAATSCASACTFIWLAGERRLLGKGARIGFHAMSYARNGGYTETHDVDYGLRAYLLDLGYALDTTATIVNTPSALVRWLDAEELDANGITSEPYP